MDIKSVGKANWNGSKLRDQQNEDMGMYVNMSESFFKELCG